MSPDPPGKFDRLKNWMRFKIAEVAINFCGIPLLYWTAPDEWEEYFKSGQKTSDQA